jgi:ATP:ADP antiporter, AAA family
LTRFAWIPDPERRDALVAFLTLLGVMTGHSVLETARDTLFLTQLPARQLPWAYIAIAVLTLVATAWNRRVLERFSRRLVLASTLVGGGCVTAAFYFVLATRTPAMLFALYVWTGLLATVVVVQFWLLAAQIFDFGQAKRAFSFVAAGGLVGAVTGSALAGALLVELPPTLLLIIAGGIFVCTAFLPTRFSSGRPPARSVRRRPHPGTSWGLVHSEPYLRRVFWSIALSTILFTGVDFVFKSMVSVEVAPEQLGPFFARFYAVTNAAALVVQLLVAPRLLRLLGVNGSLLLLPALLLAGAIGFVLTLGLGSVLILRAAEGALRHSLNRTSTEILYLPLSSSVRDRFKAIAEALGQRGGQAFASLLILGAVAGGSRPEHLAIGLAGIALAWLLVLRGLRPHYLERFRQNLRDGTLTTHMDVPDLDLHALEALIGALSSENDGEVIGALDILASYGKVHLIPALILYHPSPDVVLHAFELFSGTERTDVRRLAVRLLWHENSRIRAAALRVHSADHPEPALLEQLMEDESPLVRTTAMVLSIRAELLDESTGGDRLRAIIDGDSRELRLGLAYAARDLPPGRYAWALIRLAGVREPGLSSAVAQSMAAAADLEFLPTLVRMLADRECRDDARAAIVSLGDQALQELERAFADPALPRRVRRHLPRSVSRFVGNRAARILMKQLAVEKDEVVVLKILRGLGRMRETDPAVRVSRAQLLELASATLQRAVAMLHARVSIEGACRKAGMGTPTLALLAVLLADLEASALERAFRILKILDPGEEFRVMYSSVRSADRRVRADSRELLSNVVPPPVRSGLLALVGDGSDEERLRLGTSFYDPPFRADLVRIDVELDSGEPERVDRARQWLLPVHIEMLKRMLEDPNAALSSVAAHRLAELGVEAAPDRESASEPFETALSELARRPGDPAPTAEVSDAG